MKRIIAFVLCMSMLFSMLPMEVFASQTETLPTVTEPEETHTPETTPEETDCSSAPTETAEWTEEPVPETTLPDETEATVIVTEPTVVATEPTVIATEPETLPSQELQPIQTEMLEAEIPDLDLPSDEALFAVYAESVLYDTDAAYTGTVAGSLLTGDARLAYDALVPLLREIAAGQRSSAVLSIGHSLGADFIPDAPANFTGTSFGDEALNQLLYALLSDLAYELYWFDKTCGLALYSYVGGNQLFVEFHFRVSANYSTTGKTGTCDVNTALTGAASAAAANAQALVDTYLGCSDYEKLLGYKDEICRLTDYNYDALGEDVAYGNPWQLIWVFDGDSKTKVVCEGYSKAFQYLCDLSGFDNDIVCYNVVGYLNPSSVTNPTDGGHMWNIVTVNGSSYLVDVTNCDTGFSLFLQGGKPTKSYYVFDSLKFVYDSNAISQWGSGDGSILTLATTPLTEATFPQAPGTPDTPVTPDPPAVYMTGEELVAALEACTTVNYDLTQPVVIQNSIELPTFPGENPGIINITGDGSITVKEGGSLTSASSIDVSRGCTLTVEAGGSLTMNAILSAGCYGSIVIDGTCNLGSGSRVVQNYPGTITGIDPSLIHLYAHAWDQDSLQTALAFLGYATHEVIIPGWDMNTDGTPDPVVLTRDYAIPSGCTMVIGDEMGAAAVLRLSAGVTLINNGELFLCPGASLILDDYAAISGDGAIGSDGTILSSGTIGCPVSGTGTLIEYMSQAQFEALLNTSPEFAVSRPLTLTGSVHIPAGSFIAFNDTGSLTLADGGQLTVEGSLIFPGTGMTLQPGSSLTLAGSGSLGFYGGYLTVQEGAAYQILDNAEIYANDGTLLTGIAKNEVCNSNTLLNPEDNLQDFAETYGAGYKKFYLSLDTDYTVSTDMSIPANTVLDLFSATLTVTDGAALTLNGIWNTGFFASEAEQAAGHILVENGTLINKGTLSLTAGSTMTVGEKGILSNTGTVKLDRNSRLILASPAALEGNLPQCQNDSKYYVSGALPETLQIAVSAGEVFAGETVTLWLERWVPEYADYCGDYKAEISGEIAEHVTFTQDSSRGIVTLSSNIPGTVTVTVTALDPLTKEPLPVTAATEVVFASKTISLFRKESAPDFYEDGLWGLYPGSSVRFYGSLQEDSAAADPTLLWTPEADYTNIAEFTEDAGVFTVTASEALTEAVTVSFLVSDPVGSAAVVRQEVRLRPKANTVDMALDGEPVTGKTILFDLNRRLSVTLAPQTTPEGACNTAGLKADNKTPLVQWKSSNPAIATVKNGVVTFTGTKTGKVTITVTTGFGSTKSATVTFNAVKLTKEILPQTTNASRLIGGSSATYKVYDSADSQKKALPAASVKWTLCDQNGDPLSFHPYASVSAAGKLTTKAVADHCDVYLMAQVAGTEDSARLSEPVKVTLYPAVRSVQILEDGAPLSRTVLHDTALLGSSRQLDWSASPYAESVKSVSWSSSAAKIATISKSGLIRVLKPGTAKFTLTVTALNGKKTSASVTMKFGVFTQELKLSAMLPGGKPAESMDALRVYGKQSITFSGKNIPAAVTKPGVTWSVSSKTYASISSKGVLKTKAVTNPVVVTVLATPKDGTPRCEIPVTILPAMTTLPDSSKVNALVLWDGSRFLTKTTQTLSVGSSLTLSAVDALDWSLSESPVPVDVTWHSQNTAVAEVHDGTVQVKGPGSARITAKDALGRQAYFTVKVSKVSTGVTIRVKNGSAPTVASGKSLNLQATVKYTSGSSDSKVNWRVSDSSLATISSGGKLTAAKNLTVPASVTVWASAKDGSPRGVGSMEVRILPLTTGVEIFSDVNSSASVDISNTTQKWDLNRGSGFTLTARTFPEGTMGVTWKSSSPAIASVNRDTGLVTPKKPGTVTITATAKDGSAKKATFKLTVFRSMTWLSLPESAFIGGGKSLTIPKLAGYGVDPAATTKTLTWTLTYPNGKAVPKTVATLSAKGVLATKKATAPLTLCVTAGAADGSPCRDSCIVTVYPLTTSVTIRNAPGSLRVKETVSLTARSYPVTAANRFTWKSSSTAVASVNPDTGLVTAKKPGTVTITATAKDGSGKKATVRIRIVAK